MSDHPLRGETTPRLASHPSSLDRRPPHGYKNKTHSTESSGNCQQPTQQARDRGQPCAHMRTCGTDQKAGCADEMTMPPSRPLTLQYHHFPFSLTYSTRHPTCIRGRLPAPHRYATLQHVRYRPSRGNHSASPAMASQQAFTHGWCNSSPRRSAGGELSRRCHSSHGPQSVCGCRRAFLASHSAYACANHSPTPAGSSRLISRPMYTSRMALSRPCRHDRPVRSRGLQILRVQRAISSWVLQDPEATTRHAESLLHLLRNHY